MTHKGGWASLLLSDLPLGFFLNLKGHNQQIIIFFFLIRNEEEYINIRTETGEIKETKEREKTKGRMRGPSYTN